MQNFLILSDVHGDRDRLRRVLTAAKNVHAVFFLGDGLSDVLSLCAAERIPLYAVRGNCDVGLSCDDELVVSLGAHRVLLLHGHTVGVKGGDSGLFALARRHGADIVLYGHTHLRRESYFDLADNGPLWLFNPGSVGRPIDSPPSFGTLSVDDHGPVLFGFGRISEENK